MSLKTKIGCDLVCISRFKKSLQLEKFVNRIFHKQEIAYCEQKHDKASSYAARFAAKEAFSKALGSGMFADGLAPNDIWVQNLENGKPQIFVSNKLQTKLNSLGVCDYDVSLSHHEDYAMAVVTITQEI